MPADAPASAAPAEDVPDHQASARRIRRASRWLTVAGSIAITLLLAAPSSRPAVTKLAMAPVVAIAPVRVLDASASSAWIGDGIAQLLAADLADSSSLTVVPPERVLNAENSAGTVSDEAIHDLGERLGATWIVDGGLVHGDTLYMLDISVREASSGRVIRLFTVSAPDMVGLAQRAASRLRSTALQPSAIAHAGRDSVERSAAKVGHS